MKTNAELTLEVTKLALVIISIAALQILTRSKQASSKKADWKVSDRHLYSLLTDPNQKYSVVRMESMGSTTAGLGFSASCQLPRKEVSPEGLPKTPRGNKFRLWRSTDGQMVCVCATKSDMAHDHLYVILKSLL